MDRGRDLATNSVKLFAVIRSVALGAATAALTVAAPTGLLVGIVEGAGSLLAPYTPLAIAAVSFVPLGIVAFAHLRAHRLTHGDRAAIRIGYLTGVTLFLLFLLDATTGGWRDASAYYSLELDHPYEVAYSSGGVLYPPPFFQLIVPLRSLSWPTFLFLLSAAQFTALWVVAGPIAAPLLVIPFVALEAWYANVNLLLAAAIALGFRWPALWSVVLLTKVTPGVGLIWFAVRREWRSLAAAVGTTGVIVTISLILSPGLWVDWLDALKSSSPPDRVADFVPLPLRMALAGVIVGWGALRDRPWTVPIGAALAMPVLWPAALSVLVAVIPLSRGASRTGQKRAVDWALGAGSGNALAPAVDQPPLQGRPPR